MKKLRKKGSNFYAVILCGGSGTRFWPMSRKTKPKQFLKITSKRTLLEETLERIKPKCSGSKMLIVTNKGFRSDIKKQSARYRIPAENLLWEPVGRNTAPAILWAAAKIYQKDPDAVMGVLPSDHLILHRKKFLKLIDQAQKHAEDGYLVTMGIKPSRPETGYGYLKTRRKGATTIVEKFTEKPDAAKAKQFVKNKNFYWNSGMFFWKVSVIIEMFKKHQPQLYRLLGNRSSQEVINKIWHKCANISIDYAILEKASKVAAVPAVDIGWSDLGSWESIADVVKRDKSGNILKGDILSIACKNISVEGSKRFIATIGLDGIIVVDTPDALLVCKDGDSQRVREVVDYLKKHKRKEI